MNLFFDILCLALVLAAGILIGSAIEEKYTRRWRYVEKGEASLSFLGVTVGVHPSAGADGAPVVQVETTEELEGPEGPLIRVLINDDDAYVGVRYVPKEER